MTRPQPSERRARQSIAADYRRARREGMSPMQAAFHVKQVCAIVLADSHSFGDDTTYQLLHYRIALRYVDQSLALARRRNAHRAVTA